MFNRREAHVSAVKQTGTGPVKKNRNRSDQPLHAAQIADALLKIQTVQALVGLGKTTIYKKVAEGTFPAPIRQGSRCTRFVAGQVQAWLQAQAQKGGA